MIPASVISGGATTPIGWATNPATANYDFLASYSNIGQSVINVAAPHVCGVAAIIVGKYGHMSPAHLRAKIEPSSDDILKPGADAGSGKGRGNALRALK